MLLPVFCVEIDPEWFRETLDSVHFLIVITGKLWHSCSKPASTHLQVGVQSNR